MILKTKLKDMQKKPNNKTMVTTIGKRHFDPVILNIGMNQTLLLITTVSPLKTFEKFINQAMNF